MSSKINKNEIFIQNLKKSAPRINSLLPMFEKIANGQHQRPFTNVIANNQWLEENSVAKSIYQQLCGSIGVFDYHFYASVPYSLENALRTMEAIYLYALARLRDKDRPLKMFEPGGASGDMSRTLAKMSDGLICSLCSSATSANKMEFEKYKASEATHFYSGPYFEIQPDLLERHAELSIFKAGFDIIYESNTLQMYSNDRINQIKLLANILDDDGILILEEKLLHDDQGEFMRREQLKDKKFKSCYFSNEQIEHKQEIILNEMFNGMVNIGGLVEGIGHSFRHAALVWNSCNFYDVVASNSEVNLAKYISLLPPPFIPTEFCYEKGIPKKLLGLENSALHFKSSVGVSI